MFQVWNHEATTAAPTLLDRLGQALEAAGVVYCQWKGHWKRARWETGAGDVDLLVDPAWAERLEIELRRQGFKPAVAPLEAQMPGTESWIGFDAERLTLAHVHLHRRLIVGGYWTTVYRLAMERAVLDTTVPRLPFPVPAPELEFIMFVLRSVQRYSPRDTLAPRHPRWLADAQPELAYLRSQVDRELVVTRLAELLPTVDVAFFDACTRSLEPNASRWGRLWLRRGLERRLQPHASHPPLGLLVRRIGRSLRVVPRARGLHPARGGRVLSLLGGDGAGKSTCVAELSRWLGVHFGVMTAHLGRPPRSLTTLAVGGLLKVRRAFGSDGTSFLDLLRHVCTARDRYRLFTKARRFADAGGVALCERYPVPQNRLLVGPEIPRLLERRGGTPSALAARLLRAEAWYYRHITRPDVIMVLRVEPEIAVRRKTDEPADYVRARNRIMWETDWTGTGAHLVDAGRTLPEVLADLKALVWSEV
jgi:thymidylate kinase